MEGGKRGETMRGEADDWGDDALLSEVDPDALAAAHRQRQLEEQCQPSDGWHAASHGRDGRENAGKRAAPHPHGVGGLLDNLPNRSRSSSAPGVGGRGGFTVDPLDAWNSDRGGFASHPADEEDDGLGSDSGGAGDLPIEYVDLASPSPPRSEPCRVRVADARPSLRESRGLGEALGDGTRWIDDARGVWGQEPLLVQRQLAPAPATLGKSPYQREFEKQRKKQGKPWAKPDEAILAGVGAGGPTHRPWKRAGGGAVGAGGAEGGRRTVLAYAQGDSGDEHEDLSFGAAWARERKTAISNAVAKAGVRARNKEMAATAKRERDEAMRERTVLAEKRESARAAAKAAREERAAERIRTRIIDLDKEDGSVASSAIAVAAAAANAEAEGRKRLISIAPTASSARDLAARQRMQSMPTRAPQIPWTPPKLEDVVGAVLRWSLAHVASARRDQERNDSSGDVRGAAAGSPTTFASLREYVEFFAPLLLAELRAQVASAVEEAGGVAPGISVPAAVDSLVGREGVYHVVRIRLSRSASWDAFQENDLVVIERQTEPGTPAGTTAGTVEAMSVHALGWVEAVETGQGAWTNVVTGGTSADRDSGVRLRIRTCLVDQPGDTVRWLTGMGGGSLNQPREHERRKGILRALSRQGTSVRLSRLLSLTPSLREIQALLLTSKMPAPLCRALLAPEKTTAKETDSTDHALSKHPAGVSANVWSAVVSGLNPPQRTAVAAVAAAACSGSAFSSSTGSSRVVLIQGPPGTGKTHTIASAIALILSANAKTRGEGPGGVGDGTGRAATQEGQRLKRVLVCTQSNSAVDELVMRLARASVPRVGGGAGQRSCAKSASTVSCAPSLVRLGREEVVREDVLPYLVTRLVDNVRAAAAGASIANVQENYGAGADAKRNKVARKNNDGGRKDSSGALDSSATQARLDRLREEISAATTAAVGASKDAASSIHLDMLHAQRRRLQSELAELRKEQRSERQEIKMAAGSTWSQVVGGTEIVCATLSGAALLASEGTGAARNKVAGGRRGGGHNNEAAADAAMTTAGCAVPLFDAVVIDEAAQAVEPATLIPIRWLRPGGTVVLVGDPRQLAPTVICRGVAARRLGRSMFERLQTAGAKVHLLSVQYRMHPEIRAFPSDRFYGGMLADGCDAGDRSAAHHINVTNCGPYVAFDVACGVERRGPTSASLSNAAEAGLAAAVYGQLQKSAAAEAMAAGSDCKDGQLSSTRGVMTIGVVTPYRDQMTELRKRFASLLVRPEARFAPVEFSTVDGVQGREFDAVILSCVRAPETAPQVGVGRYSRALPFGRDGGEGGRERIEGVDEAADAARSRRMIGFLGDPRRLNVALTRPRRTLFILGHAETLRSADRTWAALWDDADRRGVSVRAQQPFASLFRAAEARRRVQMSIGDEDGGSVVVGRIRRRDASPPPLSFARARSLNATGSCGSGEAVVDLTLDDEDDDVENRRDATAPQRKRSKLANDPAADCFGGTTNKGKEKISVSGGAKNAALSRVSLHSSCTADDIVRWVSTAVSEAAAAGTNSGFAQTRAIHALERLKNMAVTVELLAETQAGKTIKRLSKQKECDVNIAEAAAAVVTAWKKLVTGG